ncbi:MAG: hypothetical protein UU73_C0004G0042 [Candidatus Daviesbacteria bacterium GW2011_GWA1_41_61]|uniref:Antitoxin n=1 Tax=Candidatus Daviesbacteria bacterium GW2011_GWA2_40_9 TaxID=1618424 RepID=A0A0G0U2K5_9BACT|nr:MAG: hypothetical protein UU26_C0031G0005 [Candidatus Daviesbacteria bacterium GW2011_GWC1_40_9]KKR83323.1 MAG: hypothetical protein UU29_C0006G0012 [Candidatus Daviesbacteria bacterium GW2011_GWA2_40_9]KKR93246.1 MAG: hypothetical protein UU44_C0003G0042 [Candidatus Daviesbacteria bacterium GW2011_GWB1_41_15]KKS14734.1 MAG: hypothetical protein UU73_C0004G0042 [Candidatus Daviesbacteria bacterium GW2011_GWA1_41_61]
MTTVSATTAREKLYDLIEEVNRSGKMIGITNRGVLKAVLISQKEYEFMVNIVFKISKRELKNVRF